MLVTTALVLSGCLRTLHRNSMAETIALTPRDTLSLPVRDSRPYWLLRSQPGWLGAHEISFGGAPGDGAVVVVRTVLFENDEAASSAFARLTPGYIQLLLRDRIKEEPPPFQALPSSDSDELSVSHYQIPLPTDAGEDFVVSIDMMIARAGRVVLFVESLGLPFDEQIDTVNLLSRSAYDVIGAEP
ncbi:MAG TPA: hypothetical protein VGW38_12450 [Chloroflexota bacterium]|nr:hypothetical protein [Chloroflexota bacterium]